MEMMIDNVDYLQWRATSFKMFEKLFQIPDGNFLNDMEILKAVLLEYSEEYSETDFSFILDIKNEIDNIDTLKFDYAELFIGPNSLYAPPYSTYYLDESQEVMGKSSVTVASFYKKGQLSVQANSTVPPDHITIQLEFLYFLSFKYSETKDEFYEDLYRSFLDEILSVWVPKWTENISTYAKTGFYKELGYLISKFVLIEWNRHFAY